MTEPDIVAAGTDEERAIDALIERVETLQRFELGLSCDRIIALIERVVDRSRRLPHANDSEVHVEGESFECSELERTDRPVPGWVAEVAKDQLDGPRVLREDLDSRLRAYDWTVFELEDDCEPFVEGSDPEADLAPLVEGNDRAAGDDCRTAREDHRRSVL